jgi:hypothetical protein
MAGLQASRHVPQSGGGRTVGPDRLSFTRNGGPLSAMPARLTPLLPWSAAVRLCPQELEPDRS